MGSRPGSDGAKAADPGWALVPSDLLAADLQWQPDSQDKYLYRVVAAGHRWKLRLNDFPDEVMFTLYREDALLAEFDERPKGWHFG